MQTHSFTLILADADEILDDLTQDRFLEMSDALYEAGCDDASPGTCEGVLIVDFCREAETLREAIDSAVADVERAGYHVARVEPGEREVFEQINARLTARQTS